MKTCDIFGTVFSIEDHVKCALNWDFIMRADNKKTIWFSGVITNISIGKSKNFIVYICRNDEIVNNAWASSVKISNKDYLRQLDTEWDDDENL